jgi:tetratricopeptide (TPR) repeat protein
MNDLEHRRRAFQRLAEEYRGLAGENLTALNRRVEILRAMLTHTRRQLEPLLWADGQVELGNALQKVGDVTSEPSKVIEAVGCFRLALLEGTRVRHPSGWASTFYNLGNALSLLGRQTDEKRYYEEAINAYSQALQEQSPERNVSAWAFANNNLAGALVYLGRSTTDPSYSLRTIEICNTALNAVAAERQSKQSILLQSTLGNALFELGRETRDSRRIIDAVEIFKKSLDRQTRAESSQVWAGTRFNLGMALVGLGGFKGEASQIAEGIDAYKRALLEQTRQRAPAEWAHITVQLADALVRVGEMTGDQGTIKQAIEAARSVMAEPAARLSPEDRFTAEATIGTALFALGKIAGDAQLLNASVEAEKQGLREFPRQHKPMEWAMFQRCLGKALFQAGELSGETDRIADAIESFKQALEELTRERRPAEWDDSLTDLGSALTRLGETKSDPGKIAEAIECFRHSLFEHTRQREPRQWALTQSNLGAALYRYGEMIGDASYYTLAVDAYREALQERTRQRLPMQWAITMGNFGNALSTLGQVTRDRKVLEEAIAALREAQLEQTSERSPQGWALTQSNLGIALRRLGDLTGDTERWSEAVQAFEEALKVRTREGVPLGRALTQSNLAAVLDKLSRSTGNQETAAREIEAYRQALSELSFERMPETCVRSSRSLGYLLLYQGRWPEGAQILRDLLERGVAVITSARTPAEQRSILGDLSGSGDSLAYALLKAGQWEAALTAASRGRAVIVQYVVASDALAAETVAGKKARAARQSWQQATFALEKAEEAVASAGVLSEDALSGLFLRRSQAAESATKAYADYVARLAEIVVSVPVMPSVEEVSLLIPEGGALAVPIVTPLGGAIIFVRRGQRTVCADDVVIVDALTSGAVAELLSGPENDVTLGWLTAYSQFRNEVASGRISESSVNVWAEAMTATLEKLDALLMQPIAEKLSRLGVPRGAEVIIMPPGRLAILPLHAARRRDEGRRWRYFVDDWAVSCIQSTLLFVSCRKKDFEPRRQEPSLLAVTNPSEDFSVWENPAWPQFENRRRIDLIGAEAGLERICSELPGWSYLSFYCHGSWDPILPEQSALIVARREKLSVRKLRQLDLSACRLAFLGACETGLIDLRQTPDEFVGLPTGLIQAGIPGVVASLWPVEAQATNDLVRAFFRLRLGGMPSAQALREAQIEFRRSREPRPSAESAAEPGGPIPSSHPFYLLGRIRADRDVIGDQN